MNSNSNSFPFAAGFVFLIVRMIFFDDIFISSLGLGFWLAISIRFISLLGKKFPIKEFIILLASFQWIVGAKISYLQGKIHYKYYMYVDESEYMNYVVIGTILFSIGISLIKLPSTFEQLQEIDDTQKGKIIEKSKTILIFGLISISLTSFGVGEGLDFIFYLISLLVFVGAAYLMIAIPEKRWIIFGVTVIVIFIRALIIGLFHDLFLVGGLLIFFLFRPQSTFLSKIGILVIGAFTLYTIQIVKKDYRKFAWSGSNKFDSFEVFSNLLLEEFTNQNAGLETGNLKSSKNQEIQNSEVTARLNQGWIISKIMNYVPEQRPHMYGESIIKSLESSVLPRFLAPNKAGGNYAKEVFEDVTGLMLSGSTSMGLSVVGEFYANYGIEGGWFAMLIYGLVLAGFMSFIYRKLGLNSPLIFCWFLFFFFQTVKAESNFITVFNHLTKAIILFIVLRLVLRQFNVNLIPDISTRGNN
jgi:hypothetical protein